LAQSYSKDATSIRVALALAGKAMHSSSTATITPANKNEILLFMFMSSFLSYLSENIFFKA
jgi:hypothetical protein